MSRSDAHQDFIARVQADPELRDRLQADPLAVLQAEGLSDSVLPDLVRSGLITPDVQGYDSWTGDLDPNCSVACYRNGLVKDPSSCISFNID